MQAKSRTCKRFMAMFLTLVMLLSIMPTAVFAKDAEVLDASPDELTLTLPADWQEGENRNPQEEIPNEPELIVPDEVQLTAPEQEDAAEDAQWAEVPEAEAQAAESAAAVGSEGKLPQGSYQVPVVTLNSAAPIPAVKTEFAKSFGTHVQIDVDEQGKMMATIIPQHMVVNFNGEYHCNILKLRGASYPEMKTEVVTPVFGKPTDIQEIQCPAKIVVELPAYDAATSGYNFELTADFMNALNGGIDKDHWMNVTLQLDFASVGPQQPETGKAPEVTAAEELIAAIGTVTLESEEAIKAARAAYDALTEEQKAQVENLAVLEQAEAELQKLQKPEQPGFTFGTAQTELKPGKYNLPVSLMNASKHTQPSMAATCIKGGSIEVMENGEAFVNIRLGSVTVGTIVGWASKWEIFNEYNITSATTPAEVISADEQQNVTEIRFKLPYHDRDGVYAKMYVAVMGLNPEAFIALDFAKATAEGDPTAPVAPVISPESCEFKQTEPLQVTITAAEGTEIYYTMDGTEPSAGSLKYTSPFKVRATTTVKAIAVSGKLSSSASEATYTMVVPQPDVLQGKAEVAFGPEKAYDVTAAVSVLGGKIVQVELGHNAAESNHASSKPYADKAMTMADGFKNLSVKDKAAISAVDGVTGATVTSDAYRAAVLNALKLDTPTDLSFGSAGTEIQPGTYNVPIALRHADKHGTPSNAAAAFPAMGKLTVAEDGTATLETIVQPVTIGPITDMAYNVLVYQEDNYTSKTVPATILESVKKPETMINPGIDVPTKISFTIPNHAPDGVYLNFTVDAMGGANPDGWLQIDYAKHAVPGGIQHFKGSAKVNQFGKYTIHTDVSVQDGVITGVAVTADSFISETHKPTNLMKIDQAYKALKNTWNGMAPTQENAEKIFKAIMKPTAPDEVIDGISGATYSGRAIRDAVMDAFNLEYQDEIINVPESVEPGVYEVEIGYYSDVVWHSLVENVKAKAELTVKEDGSMSLSFDTLSGTEKEPLYILGFNGVYPNNDRSAELTMEGCEAVMGLSSNDYEDEFFPKGTQVVNHLTFPLLGGLSKVYNTNAYLYVPAMKRLNGELSGVYFKDGHFNVDIFAKIYWDSMKRTDGPVEPPKPVEGEKKLVDLTMLNETKDTPSMCDIMFDRTAKVTVTGDSAIMELLVAYPVPAFPTLGTDGTLKNFAVQYNGVSYEATSDITTKPLMTVKDNNPGFGLVKGDKIPAQVLTVELPRAALLEETLLVNTYVNVVMNTDVAFRMQLSNLRDDESAQPPVPETQTEKPAISPNGGKFVGREEVTLTAEQGAVIYYTTDGSVPTENSQKYTKPIVVTKDTTVKAVAKAEGKTLSAVASADFVLQSTAVPAISPNGGTFQGSVTVTLSCTDQDAVIYYTKDGSDPRVKAYKYTGPFTLTDTTTLKVCAKAPDRKTSAVAEATFTKQTEGEGIQLKDGKYYVDAALWHEIHDKPSMGNAAFANSPKALVTVSGGKVTTVQIATNPVKVGTYVSALIEAKANGQPVNVLKRAPLTTSAGNEIQFIQLFNFPLPEFAQPSHGAVTYVPVDILVPDTPMGEGYMQARLKLMWSTAKPTDDGNISVPNKPVIPEVDKHPAVDQTDAKTGVKVHADAGVFTETVKLVVTPITEKDKAYEKAAKDLEKVGTKFVLYDVHFVNEKGAEVQPKGVVSVSYPIPAGYDVNKVAVYRINETGKPTKIGGVAKDGFYEVVQKHFSQYALVDTGSVDTKGDGMVTPNPDANSNTGDSTPLFALLAMMVLSGAAIVVLLRKKRQQ